MTNIRSFLFTALILFASPAFANCERLSYYWFPVQTISDLGYNLKLVFYTPASLLIHFLEHGVPKLYYFLEMDCTTGNGVGGFFLSLLGWGLAFAVFVSLYSMSGAWHDRLTNVDFEKHRREKGYDSELPK
jgi:hypothetical protein